MEKTLSILPNWLHVMLPYQSWTTDVIRLHNVFLKFVDMGKQLTHVLYQEDENADHNDINFEQRMYIYYVRLMSGLKSTFGSNGEVVLSWDAVHEGKSHACPFLIIYSSRNSYIAPLVSLIEQVVHWLML